MLESDRPSSLLVFVALLAAMALCYPASFLLGADTFDRLARERGLIQIAGATLFLLASVVFFVRYLKSVDFRNSFFGRRTRRNVFWLLLALLMFVCFGEEASWGQHLIGFETPEFMAGWNAQDETNLHNLWIFHQWRRDGSEKGFWGLMVNGNRLLSIFWLGYFIVLPISAAKSERARQALVRAGIPVPPIWVGCLFLASFFSYKVFAAVAAGTVRAFPLDELKETTYAAAFAIYAVYSLASAQPDRGFSQRNGASFIETADDAADANP